MERLNLDYLKPQAARGYEFLMIPKLLITHEAFSSIDYGAKILYSLMLNRASLSAINQESFTDASGHLYIIYTVETVMETMQCSNKTAVKMLKQLEEIGLIEKKRQGQGKPSLIFMKDFNSVHFQKCKKYTSESVDSTLLDVNNVHSNKNKANETNYINGGNQSINQSISINQSYQSRNGTLQPDDDPTHEEEAKTGAMNMMDSIDEMDYHQCMERVKQNIEYDILRYDAYIDLKLLDEMVKLITNTLCNTQEEIRINGGSLPAYAVKEELLRLNGLHIQYVYECMNTNTTKIHNIRAYLLSALYNAPSTMGSYYKARVRHTLYGDDYSPDNDF